MSKESKPRERWRRVMQAPRDRPNTFCKGCGYYHVVYGVHRRDCTLKNTEGESK